MPAIGSFAVASCSPIRTGGSASVGVTILLTGFVAATYGFGFYLFAQLVPDMRRDLGFGSAAVGTITPAAQCAFLGFAVLGGWLTARIGGGIVVARGIDYLMEKR